ncbi:GNAT family N-acetyltransferase [Halospeciosus flavus]|uniref:GNAT family N-acetyltransferase n=1 Tax=Halospeciosus flavus TaxID=3032283 RepID=A0ABD5Z1I2_9EURY|nr:N-acetyltransferase [Halospeciosus flavus]
MSATVEKRVVPPGSQEYLEEAWQLKERIREEEGLLKQRRGFFSDAYRRARVYLFVTTDAAGEEELVGFAATRRDGYLLFLAVDPEYRGEGFGERLVGQVADDAETVSCHARASNQNALDFYRHLGFSIERQIDNYYEDGEGAYYLRLGDRSTLRDRLSDVFGR